MNPFRKRKRPSVFQLSLKEAVNECTSRLAALDTVQPIRADTDPRLIPVFGMKYAVFQFLYTAALPLRDEHGSVVLIDIKYGSKIILDFEAAYDPDDGSIDSEAHSYLVLLRSLCNEWNVHIAEDFNLDQQYDGRS